MSEMPREHGGAQKRVQLAQRLEQQRRVRGLTVRTLATKAGYEERTVRKVLKGVKTRIETLQAVCTVLGVDQTIEFEEKTKRADARYGGYILDHFDDSLGTYVSLRRSFSNPLTIIRSIFEISWSDEERCMQFFEYHKYLSRQTQRIIDYSQRGKVYTSNNIGLLHLVTSENGAIRLISVSKLITEDQSLRGAVLTQTRRGVAFFPATSPIVLRRDEQCRRIDQLSNVVGQILPNDEDFDDANEELLSIERDIAAFSVVHGRDILHKSTHMGGQESHLFENTRENSEGVREALADMRKNFLIPKSKE